MEKMFISTRNSPGCLVQVLLFAFVGWWLGEIWVAVAWLCMLTIIGIPIGVAMMNKIPQIIALRGSTQELSITIRGEVATIREESPEQPYPLIIRGIWFLAIGWWLSALWMQVAYVACLSVVGIPVGFWMFDRVPMLISLHQ